MVPSTYTICGETYWEQQQQKPRQSPHIFQCGGGYRIHKHIHIVRPQVIITTIIRWKTIRIIQNEAISEINCNSIFTNTFEKKKCLVQTIINANKTYFLNMLLTIFIYINKSILSTK